MFKKKYKYISTTDDNKSIDVIRSNRLNGLRLLMSLITSESNRR
jgi:hypothetical protein